MNLRSTRSRLRHRFRRRARRTRRNRRSRRRPRSCRRLAVGSVARGTARPDSCGAARRPGEAEGDAAEACERARVSVLRLRATGASAARPAVAGATVEPGVAGRSRAVDAADDSRPAAVTVLGARGGGTSASGPCVCRGGCVVVSLRDRDRGDRVRAVACLTVRSHDQGLWKCRSRKGECGKDHGERPSDRPRASHSCLLRFWGRSRGVAERRRSNPVCSGRKRELAVPGAGSLSPRADPPFGELDLARP